ncbi:MAG TPA: ABC transporter ATP-binding protein [Solirubrobacteraceae bacterium]|nr:ABC transporter ATP-binding protein [Solirubrobacteraceae bacterium]
MSDAPRTPTQGTPLLEGDSLDVYYGPLRALHDVSLEVHAGETVALIGANGAGKSTLLQTLAGAKAPGTGRVRWDGEDITALSDYRRVALGLSLTPEGRRLFKSLTVEENLQVGAHPDRSGDWSIERVYETFPLVAKLRRRRADALSGGEQQAVAISRSLMSNPRLLMIDEVSLGLAPVIVEQLYDSLRTVIAQGTSLLLVEQDLELAMEVCTRLYCMLEGRIVLSGRPGDVTRDEVVAAYFGTSKALQEKVAAE